MLKRFTINQLLFVSHLMLVLVLIAGMSASRYQSEWESRVNYANERAERTLTPLVRDFSAAVAGRNYANLMMPSQNEALFNIGELLFLDIQGKSDYSENSVSVRYSREHMTVWRTDVTQDEINDVSARKNTLMAALDNPENQHKVRNRKLNFVLNKTVDDLNALQKSTRLSSSFTPRWPPSSHSEKAFQLHQEDEVLIVQLPLINKNGGHVWAVFDAANLFTLKQQIFITLAIEAFVALCVSLLLIIGVTHWLVAPLSRLAKRIDHDIEHLDISDLEELRRNDEIGVLARGLHTLTLKAQTQMKILRHQSDTDALTGLAGRHSYTEHADAFFQATRAENKLFGIVVCDIDHFKAFNDTFGHGRGDVVIKSTANAILSALRKDDLCFRIGGEEFVALLQIENASALETVAERMRCSVEDLAIPHAAESAVVTLSIGALLITPSASAMSFSDAFDEADSLLYRAKRSGRNQIAIGTLQDQKPPPRKESSDRKTTEIMD
ncbi:GGDEF domain-containing protein [Enterovibrio sp. FF113]|uniref:GGDEF domain-containing protein n=1 Tax=Enterovibrio sp. FF113 TaxID=3230010 RepID=UPI00352F1D8C